MAATRTIGTSLVKTTGTPKTMADLTSIGTFGVESGEIDVTTLDSGGSYKEFIAGFKDAGEIALKGIVKSPDNFEDMLGYAESQTIYAWRVQFPSGAKWDFQGFIKSWKQAESTVDGVEGFEGSLRITGKPTYTAVAGVSA